MAKILVIEDEAALRENMIETLELGGFETYEAENGVAGVAVALEQKPDLILCDIMMDEMDGYGVLQALQESPETAAIPFVFVTALGDRQAVRQGMMRGADDYVTKPFSADELLQAVTTRLERHSKISEQADRKLDSARQQLTRMVTHELRTPLASMNTVLDIISRQAGQMEQSQLEELLETVRYGSRRLSRLVEQMVLLTQLETGMLSSGLIAENGVTAQSWDILITATNLARRFSARQRDVNIQMNERDRKATVICDPNALRHAMAELVSNALIFSPDGGTVTVAQWRSNAKVWISVLDAGPGMSPEQIARATQGFQQIDREVREQQGMGIGLSLARRIVEAHGGVLEIRSVVGKGTQVVIGLPVVNS